MCYLNNNVSSVTNMDSGIEKIVNRYPRKIRENLIPVLQDIQSEFGYLPEEAIPHLSEHLELPAVKIYSVATYYNMFHFESRGKYHLQVCAGTGCHLEGSDGILREISRILDIGDGEMTIDRTFSLELVPCLGACHLSPVLGVNGVLHGQLTNRKLAELLDHLRIT
ncbi:MAG: NAD(P)H-dependent oxidoreductase subunit E [Bacteroidetes bacterium]|nr:NAD(P)H-dependent oxidoreductase subunit E [Bacteroidota bacterium]MBT4409884.1 NAD(P)H-dependent oxidoreductase subunit E [Bacteroidota bacterium]MBT7091738.1 NAD(P)H-dependent oxidoreductase subunit E [Bacteroidota bacterium]MBT7463108.1 NAD(P)H-dependent oxidoreductase subunit E [Bacteroidota bacterium]